MKRPDLPPHYHSMYPGNGGPHYGQNGYVAPEVPNQAPNQTPYRNQNANTHFVTGLLAGAAVAYLLSNKAVQRGLSNTGNKAWSTLRGEVEELKERLEDTKAELDYYRQRDQDK